MQIRPTRRRTWARVATMALAVGATWGANAMQVNQPSDDVLNAVLKGTNWRAQDVSVAVDPVLKPSTPACSLWVAQDKRVPQAGLVRFALAADGKLLAGSDDMSGLTRVLRECLREDAATWAQAVALYVNAMAPQVLREGDLDAQQLRKAGVTSANPSLRVHGGEAELRFVMRLHDLNVVSVTARVPQRGPVRVAMQPVEP